MPHNFLPRLSSLLRTSASPVLNVSRSGMSKAIPVKQSLNRKARQSLVSHARGVEESLIDSSGEGFGYGFHAREMHDIQVRGAFQYGKHVGKGLDTSDIRHVKSYTAGSGNTLDGAVSTIGEHKGPHEMDIATTSGGWPQNISRLFTEMAPDVGTLNSAAKQGVTSQLSRRVPKAESISFSQGSMAERDAQDAFSTHQLAELSRDNLSFTTWGGAAKLRVKHSAFKGIFDPVPLVSHALDLIRPTSSGKQSVSWSKHGHKGTSYAKSHIFSKKN